MRYNSLENKHVPLLFPLLLLLSSCLNSGQNYIDKGKQFLSNNHFDKATEEFKKGLDYYTQKDEQLKIIECTLLKEIVGLEKGFFINELEKIERLYIDLENIDLKNIDQNHYNSLRIMISLCRIRAYIYSFEFKYAAICIDEVELLLTTTNTLKNTEKKEFTHYFLLYKMIIHLWEKQEINDQVISKYKNVNLYSDEVDFFSILIKRFPCNIDDFLKKNKSDSVSKDLIWLITGMIYFNHNIDFKIKMEYLEKIASFFKMIGHQCFSGYTYYFSAIVSEKYMEIYDSPHMQNTLDNYEKALPVLKRVENKDFYYNALLRSGIILSKQGHLIEAFERFENTLPFYEKNKDVQKLATLHDNMASIYKKIGNLPAAEREYKTALKIYKDQIKDFTKIAASYNNIGVIYKDQLLFEKARECFNEAITIISNLIRCEVDDRKKKALYEAKFIKLNNLAEIEIYNKRYNEALGQYLSKLTVDIAKTDLTGSLIDAKVKFNCAKCHYFLIRENSLFNPGMCRSILELVNEAYLIFKKSNYTQEVNEVKYLKGQIYFNIQDYESALKIYNEVLNYFEASKSLSHVAGVCYSLYLTESALGNTEIAIKYLEKSVNNYDEFIRLIPSYEIQKKFYNSYLPYFETLTINLINEEKIREAFYYSEMMKARILLQQMNQRKIDPLLNIPESTKIKLRELSIAESVSIRNFELCYSNNTIEGYNDHLDNIKLKIDKIRNERSDIFREIRVLNAHVADINEAYAVTVEDIQKCIQPGQAMLNYIFAEDLVYAFIIDNEKVDVICLADDNTKKRKLQNKIKLFRMKIEDRIPTFTEESCWLYNFLISPLYDKLSAYSHMIIIPSDELFYIPFYALKNSNTGQYLIDEYNGVISNCLSATVYVKLFQNKSSNYKKEYVAFGNPFYQSPFSNLPYSEKELHEIQSLFNEEKRDVFTREKATETLIKRKDLSSYRYVHFSCHGINYGSSDFLSFPALILSNSAGEIDDGYLKYDEISSLKINADLVLLSACQTGLGEMVKGDGLVGLNQAFIIAGAKAIISSLWSVDDYYTSILIVDFFKKLKNGNTIPSSLKSSIINIKSLIAKETEIDTPCYWAPFVITGYTH